MLVNSAGYKILTSVDQYLELVNSSLPGEWSWRLRGEQGCLGVSCTPRLLGHLWGPLGRGDFRMWTSLETFWKGWFWGVASLGTFWKRWFQGVGLRGRRMALFPHGM